MLIALVIIIFLTSLCNSGLAQEKFKVATCQFPVTGKIKNNADYIKKYIKEAALNNADIVHFSEAALSGYPPGDIPSFEDYDRLQLGSGETP